MAAYLATKHDIRIVRDAPDDVGPVTQRSYDKTRKILHLSSTLRPAQQAFQMATQLAFIEREDVLRGLLRNANFSSKEAPALARIGLANYFSRKSRAKTGTVDEVFLGEENEWLIIYSKEVLLRQHYDYFIFGHRHLPIDVKLAGNSRYINLGEWIKYFSYAEFDGEQVYLKYYTE